MVKRISQAVIAQYLLKQPFDFQEARLKCLKSLNLSNVLANSNPYLLRIGPFMTPRERVGAALDAHLSMHEESLLGEVLKGLAIHLCQKAYGAHGKSSTEGIDLEFELDNVRYLVAIKSGPNWGNSAQIRKMQDNFKQAAKIYRQGANALRIECVNGCCYGKQKRQNEDKGNYRKLCGQRFWEFITGDSEIYTRIIEPIGEKARERNDEFRAKYELAVDACTEEFRKRFCDASNTIQWQQLVEFISAPKPDRNPRGGQ
ncbi:MAG: PmeII family type II restriction endonuclease [Phycisphaerae bacterium]